MPESIDDIIQRLHLSINKFRSNNERDFALLNSNEIYTPSSIQRRLVNNKESFVAEVSERDDLVNLKFTHTKTSDIETSAKIALICEEMAKAILDCGNLYFHLDKNATVFLEENFMHEASIAVNGLKLSEEMKRVFEDTRASWHWHGW